MAARPLSGCLDTAPLPVLERLREPRGAPHARGARADHVGVGTGEHGEARRGHRLKAHAPFGHWKTQTFVAALRCDGLSAPWIVDGPMNRKIFERYVQTQLAPTLRPGDVVILDNLASHKSEKAGAALRERGAWFLFLPPYSPDLNPIEMAFAKLKAHLRRIKARSIDALWQAVGNICDLYSEEECWNYLKEAGYVAD